MTKNEKKYSLAHLTVIGCPPPEMTYIAHRAGYDYVSFRPIPLGLSGEPKYHLAEDRRMLKETKRAMTDTGLKLMDVELARILREKNPKDYIPAMGVAAELGGSRILSSAWTPEKNYIVDFYAELCDLAKGYGLTVDFEFVTWSAVKTLNEAKEILRAANKDNCGIMIDTLHFYRSRVALEELDDVPRKWFHFAHICDAPKDIPDMNDTDALVRTGRAERLYIGEGAIDIASIINRMPDIPLSIELPHEERAREYGYAEHAARCIESARAYFARHHETL
ncbi:MAG: sugar phosphate isomerase/epimerase [Synergistaceae bacterium]|jgi:sugar phosphate isomerase/epimerase|nr:sugar phosphate isomerase/epimerase [Synergistaceae bacterium]